MSEEYKQKSTIINLYQVLKLTSDVCLQPNCNELIKIAYLQESKKCHPDKNKDKTKEQLEGLTECFYLIQEAYKILIDEKTRANYNHKLKLDKQSSSSFVNLKQNAVDYAESKEYKVADSNQIAGFKEQMRLMDSRRDYSEANRVAIPKKEAKKKLQEYEAERNKDIDYKPERLFSDGAFDGRKFNAAFDLSKKQSNFSDLGGGSEMTPFSGIPSAWNGAGTVANFSNFDDLDNAFVDDRTRYDTSKQLYGNVDFTPVHKHNFNIESVSKLEGGDYYDNHNELDDDYYANMKKDLSTRQSSQNYYENMEFNDFKRDDTAGYGIHDQLGLNFENQLSLDLDSEDIATKFEKLMAEREKPILPLGDKK